MRRLLQVFRDLLCNQEGPATRSMRLLMGNLTRSQREQLARDHCFYVVGGDSGRRYRIEHGNSLNIEEFDDSGKRVMKWCFLPEGNLPTGDVLLAQKIALELFETETKEIANNYPWPGTERRL